MSRLRVLTVYSIYILIPCILRTQAKPQTTEMDIGSTSKEANSLPRTTDNNMVSKCTSANSLQQGDVKPTERSDNETNEVAKRTTAPSLNETSIVSSLLGASAERRNPLSFMVSIQIKEQGKFKHQCGGTILSKDFVISAAHCTLKPRNLNVKDLYVVGGSHKLYHKNAKRFRVQRMKKHPEFIPLHGNDIVLLQVNPEIPIDNVYFSTVQFQNTTRKEKPLNALVIGWGRTQPNTPKDLESLTFRTISNEDCFINHKFKYLTDSEICAISSGEGRGACDGDSGGPLIDLQQQSLYGILSYGRKPCESGKPYAFTRISVFVSWIEQEMENMLRLNAQKNNKV